MRFDRTLSEKWKTPNMAEASGQWKGMLVQKNMDRMIKDDLKKGGAPSEEM